MVHKPLIRPYFWGGMLGGGWLTSHEICDHDVSVWIGRGGDV